MAEQPQISPEQARTGCLSMLRTLFTMMIVMPVFLFALKGHAVNHAQMVYRISTLIIGVVGLVVVHILLARAQRQISAGEESPTKSTVK